MSSAPLYSEIGKCANDLLNDDYNFDVKADIKTVTANKVTFTSSVTRDHKKNTIVGALKTKFRPCHWASIDTAFDTNGKVQVNSTLENFAEGLKINTENNFATGNHKESVEYVNQHFTVTGSLEASKITTSASFATSNFAVGLETTDFDVNGAKTSARFTGEGFTVAAKANKLGDEITASYLHEIKRDLSVAGQYSLTRSKGKHFFEVGVKSTIDKDAYVRSKLNSDGIFSIVYSQFVRPGVNVKLSGAIDSQNLGKDSHKVGVSVSASL